MGQALWTTVGLSFFLWVSLIKHNTLRCIICDDHVQGHVFTVLRPAACGLCTPSRKAALAPRLQAGVGSPNAS